MSEQSAGTDNSIDGVKRVAARYSRLYLDALRAADAPSAFRVASTALGEGLTLPELCQRVIAPAMHEIGKLWERGALTVADEHLATALTHRVLAALRPPVEPEGGVDSRRTKAMLAAVEGEQHALGLRMAADLLEEAGFHTIYLGADVPTDALLQAVDSLAPDILALSATMPELSVQLEEVGAAVHRTRPQIELLFGGQAASPRISSGRLIPDLELLPERLPPQL
ncbi:MAG TPA: cobalamin-dependent protein [Solirubrobacterales bacterium]